MCTSSMSFNCSPRPFSYRRASMATWRVSQSISMSPTGQCIQLQPLDVQWLPSRDLASGEVTLMYIVSFDRSVRSIVVSLHFVWTQIYFHHSALDSSCFQHWTSSMVPVFSCFFPVFSKHQKKLEENSSQNLLDFWKLQKSFRKFPEAFDALQCLEHPSTASVPHRWVLELHSWTSHRLASWPNLTKNIWIHKNS